MTELEKAVLVAKEYVEVLKERDKLRIELGFVTYDLELANREIGRLRDEAAALRKAASDQGCGEE
jgi:hypothetical protein